MHNLSAQFHSLLDMARDSRTLLGWLAAILTAAFVSVVIGGWLGRALLVITISAGYLLAYPAAAERDLYLPWTAKVTPEGWDKIAWSVAVIGLLGLLLSLRKVPSWARLVAALVIPAAGVGLAVWPLATKWKIPAEKWTEAWQWGVGSGIVTGLIWLSTEGLASKQKGVAPLLVTGFFAAGVAGILANIGQLKGATFAVVPAVAVLGAFLGGLLSKRPLFDRAPIFVWIATFGILLGYGAENTDEKAPLFLAIIAAAPLLGWVGQMKPVSKWKPWKRELVRGLLVATPIVTVVVLASLKSKKAAEASPKGGADNIGGWDE
jgi:hypothetical protein